MMLNCKTVSRQVAATGAALPRNGLALSHEQQSVNLHSPQNAAQKLLGIVLLAVSPLLADLGPTCLYEPTVTQPWSVI